MWLERIERQSRHRAPVGPYWVHFGQIGFSHEPHRKRVWVFLCRAQK
jgi:hypothetical protein